MQQKQRIEDQTVTAKKLYWCCPKCRSEYVPEQYPTRYVCFCGKTENPKYQPFLVPHSCGEICKKALLPLCGHQCLLLCHPGEWFPLTVKVIFGLIGDLGPCPPCPVTVNVTCYCASQPPSTKRCCNRGWSCGGQCGKPLTCGKHSCNNQCHSGDCLPCTKKSVQKCLCGTQQKLRDCATPEWQCDKVWNEQNLFFTGLKLLIL